MSLLHSPFRRVGVVNRGEPVIRFIRAARAWSARRGEPLEVVAFFTESDRGSPFVREADEAICIGEALVPGPDGRLRSAYLDVPRMVALLKATGCDAVWPGWGFLSENPEFADACTSAGLVFIGPSGDSMRRLGDKIAAKRLAEAEGVPVSDWSRQPVASADEGRTHAARIGFPVLLKAAAGGGGRGIRLVRDPAELDALFQSASDEARSAFGDPTLLVEAFVEEARHVEVQVVADRFGRVVALGTRDCSMQRRHQKVLEEAPAPFLSPELERTLLESAERVARASGYVNAGTAEFLVRPDGSDCAFLEMNTRLQVEHPVTECVTGVDLVGLQIDIARGEPLPEGPFVTRGHAIEARLNAEDPDDRFAPSAGRLYRFDQPTGPGIRVDSGFVAGSVIPGEFDSMLAKVIATGATRDEAMARLREALSRFHVAIEGGPSNRTLLLELVSHEAFRAGPVTTRWLDRHLETRRTGPERRLADAALVAAAVSEYVAARRGDVLNFLKDAQRGLPSKPPASQPLQLRLRLGDRTSTVDVCATGPHRYRVTSAGLSVDARFDFTSSSTAVLHYRGHRHRIVRVVTPSAIHVEVDGVAHRLARASDGRVVAPVPAAVTFVHAKPGDRVRAGDRLVTLEVMKMEVGVDAPIAGRVARVLVDVSSRVAAGDALVAIEAASDEERVEQPWAPFEKVTEAREADERDEVLSTLRSALLGYDVSRTSLRQAVEDLRDGRVWPSRDSLLGLVEAYVAREMLFDRRPGEDGIASVEHLTTYLRLPRMRGEGLPEWFLSRLRRALGEYEVHDLEPGLVLESALLRLFQAHSTRDERDTLWMAVLTLLARETDGDTHPSADEARIREALESFAALVIDRNRRLADAAWSALYVLCDRPRLVREGRELLVQARTELERREWGVDLPQGTFLSLVGEWLTRSPDERAHLLDLHIERLHGPRQTVARTADGCGALYRLESGWRVGLISTLGDVAHAAARCWTELSPHVRTDERIELDAFCPQPDHSEVARLDESGLPDAALLPASLARVSLSWGNVHEGRLGRTWERTAEGLSESRLYRDLHPARVEAAELRRLSGFTLERLPGTGEVVLVHGRAKEDPADERLFCIGEVERVDIEKDASGRVVRVPSFERVFLFALHLMRAALGQPGRHSRLVWNRLVLVVRPPLLLSRNELETIAQRLIAFTPGLGLEKVVVRANVPGADGTLRAVSIELSNPTGSGLAFAMFDAKTAPLKVLGTYERRVVEARRRGLFYPYELIHTLSSSDANGPLPPGSFQELELDEAGTSLQPVDRPVGGNQANLVVGLIENRFPPFDDGLRRVLIAGDPTRGMGALSEPECRRIIAAFDLAEREGLPVEWVPVSSGAKIAMDSGTENLDWTAAVLARIVRFTQAGGVVNVVVDGVCVGAQSYWNAEATMLMHCRGTLVMTPRGSMLLTGKKALEFAGSVAAEDNLGIGGYEQIMGPNGQAQYFAPDLVSAYQLLFRHYRFTYVSPGESRPRLLETSDGPSRDVTQSPYTVPDEGFSTVGDVFDEALNPGRKKPFSIRPIMRAVLDQDVEPLERWARWQGAESAVVLEGSLVGEPVTCIGIESRPVRRKGDIPHDGPDQWTSGTLFPLSSKKVARALWAASGVRPVIVLANLSGFDGSPDSLRNLQLEYGAEIGRAVVNFRGPLIFCVISRYHGGAYVVFSQALNPNVEAYALEGSYASVIGGAPAAAVVFPGLVKRRAMADPRVVEAKAAFDGARGPDRAAAAVRYEQTFKEALAQAQAAVAREFDAVHSVERARQVGSLRAVIHPSSLRLLLADRVVRARVDDEEPATPLDVA